MACPEVQVGRVEIAGEDYAQMQQSVDAGHNLWRLSPVRTTQVVGSEYLGLRPTDVYTFVEQYYDPASQLQQAVVRVKHKKCSFLVELYQPLTQGRRGVWVVQTVTEE